MKPGQASQTAVLVCMARAMAHGRTSVATFADSTALALLPDDARARVERYRLGGAPESRQERIRRTFLDKRTDMMVARTVAIDQVVRVAASPQLVILGAGLDGRAWRMPELNDTVVFEVDHPDSQRDKEARTTKLAPAAREIRFVPVDFERQDLDAALAAAGHDPTQATTWIWEGVVMYLERAAVESTLAVVERRSAASSCLTIAYVAPSALRWLVGVVVRRLGEPIQSVFTPGEIRALLTRYGFHVSSDEDISTIGHALSPGLGRATRAMRHLRIVTAERR